jgi:alginate O-acetyltransferase complex protein AlgI
MGALFGVGTSSAVNSEALYYLKSYGLVLIIAAIGSTKIPKLLCEKLSGKNIPAKVMTFLEPAYVAAVLIAVTAYLVDGSFNPFIYFRF